MIHGRWSRTDDGIRLNDWIKQNQIEDIMVVSPHLDDAAFSLSEFLTRPGLPPRSVFTVLTKAAASTSQEYAIATGFENTEQEYQKRREEDMAAMTRLNVPFVHCNGQPGCLDAETAKIVVKQILEGKDFRRTLILLPLGAGGKLNPVERFIRMLLRLPVGSKAHQEHIWVRDDLRIHIAPTEAVVGYYAEIPYQWANSPRNLLKYAHLFCGGKALVFNLQPDTDAKLAVAYDYKSQIEHEFGRSHSYQKRTASIPERIFLPI